MKIARPTPGNNDNTATDEQMGPKLRNINDKDEDIIYDEKPEGADKRLVITAIVMGVFIIGTVISGKITNSSLASQLEEQNKLLSAAQSEALIYGITEDEDGDIVLPDSTSTTETSTESQNVSDLEWDSLEERNDALLNAFAECILTYDSISQYNARRQELIDTWGFTENSKLLSNYMRPLSDGETLDDISMTFRGATIFTLSNDGKNMTYFMICKVASSSKGTSGNAISKMGNVGVRLTINEDGTLSNVTVQTLTIGE